MWKTTYTLPRKNHIKEEDGRESRVSDTPKEAIPANMVAAAHQNL